MPRLTKRAIAIKECEALAKRRVKKAFIRLCFDEEDSLEDDIDQLVLAELVRLKSSRYVAREAYRQWNSGWERMLEDGTYMSDDEFLSNFRMDRSCVRQLNGLIEDDEVFQRMPGKVGKQASMLHVMVFLKFLGSYGNAAALQKIGHMLGISKGAVNDYIKRTCDAILKHREQVIKWPSIEERRNISGRIRKVHGFVNCIGLIDGTLFPLAFAPTLNGEDYYTRKGDYAIKGLVICDDAARITWIEVGWPGSVHDNRVWTNSEIYVNRAKYFDQKEYLLGDSAFSTSAVMVPAFKKGHNTNLSEEKKYFNTKLAKVRIKSEHCIGLLKARFQRLRGFRRVISNKSDLDAILKVTLCACVLHNLLIEHPVPADWFDDDIEDLEQEDELNQSAENSSSGTRCNQVFAYMLEAR